jgi:CubicO group peptidase (beta-lactamase class C family)
MRVWNRRSFMLGPGLAAAAVCASPRTAQGQSRRVRVDVESLIAAERQRIADAMAREVIPGVAVCLIHDGQLAWTEGFGVTDRSSNRRIASDTIFSIQSTSKNFTATAIMLAVQRGILDLDEPITAYLPQFTVHSRFEVRPQEKMTLRLLLSNRAGFTHEAPVGNNFDPAFESFEAHVRSISQTWLRFPVGERYRYSNLGFDLAGFILQARMGMPFADCLRAMIFEPLGMKDSTVSPEVYASRDNRALGHQQGYETVPLKTPLIPSGGVYTSARDIAAYCMFHLNRGRVNGKALLQEALWNEMHAFSFGGDYGLGAMRKELRYGGTDVRLLSHAGGGFGFGCVFQYCPDARLAWVALFNRPATAAYRFGEQLVGDALTRRYGAATPRLAADDLPSIALPTAWLQKYAGRYLGRNAMSEVEVKDGVLALRSGDTVSPIRFVSPDELVVADAQGDAVLYRYIPASAFAPAHLECWIGEKCLDYNDGALDAPGPDEPAWTPYLGTFRIERWSKPADQMVIQRRNGYLYLNDTRLIAEGEPGLFFTSDGEAVDFRHDAPTWRNVRMQRV